MLQRPTRVCKHQRGKQKGNQSQTQKKKEADPDQPMRGAPGHEIRQSDTFACGRGEVMRGAREGEGHRSGFVGQAPCGVESESEVVNSVKIGENDREVNR